MKRILLVDDSSQIQSEVKKTFGSQFEIHCASSLREARGLLVQYTFDLILLEAVLPDGEGYSFCSERKKDDLDSGIPIIFLTHRALVTDKLKGFAVGAEDYVVKPFEPLELGARIEARLRKSQVLEKQSLQWGALTLVIPFQKALLREGNEDKDLRLTPTEFRLLYFFVRNEDVVLTRDQLLSTIWSDEVHVLTRTIDKHISTLKKKLGTLAHSIQSIHSRGYRFSLLHEEIVDSQGYSHLREVVADVAGDMI